MGHDELQRDPERQHSGPATVPEFLPAQIDRELHRSRRYARPLSILVLRPNGPQVAPASSWTSAALAASECMRASDIVGWIAGERIIMLLPETGAEGARALSARVGAELQRRFAVVGDRPWFCELLDDPLSFSSARDLLSHVAA